MGVLPKTASGVLACPRCGESLSARDDALVCDGCAREFPIEEGIPLLFWEDSLEDPRAEVTSRVQEFYEETPFPNYDDFDSVASLMQKAREGLFARLLDAQIPAGALILECGCGTGQLSNFLSIANRTVYATDMCLNSLRLGHDFATANQLDRVTFLQMNLFHPAFRPGAFDLVISNGVLHHTSDPRGGFRSIGRLVKPGGYILIGLYHRYGRLITDARRLVFRWTGDRFQWLDPNLRRQQSSAAKKRAWFMDQYKHPHESKHTMGEALEWLEQDGFDFVKSIPSSVPFRQVGSDAKLFAPEAPGTRLERGVAELAMIARGSREGGFFIFIGRKRSVNARGCT